MKHVLFYCSLKLGFSFCHFFLYALYLCVVPVDEFFSPRFPFQRRFQVKNYWLVRNHLLVRKVEAWLSNYLFACSSYSRKTPKMHFCYFSAVFKSYVKLLHSVERSHHRDCLLYTVICRNKAPLIADFVRTIITAFLGQSVLGQICA